MNYNNLISVIIPVYNREKIIKSCLEMVTNQTHQNFEIIVVDDGSSDNSVNIIKEFKQIKLIQHEKNKGLSAARNTGINNATGKYIHFLDDDDKINLEFYQNMLKASEKTDADMSVCCVVNEKQRTKSQLFTEEKVYTTNIDKYTITYVGKNGYVWRYLFKLDFIKNNNLYFEEGRLIEDLPFSFQAVYYANKIVTVPNAEYFYAFTPNSILNDKDDVKVLKRKKDYFHARNFVLKFAKEHGDFKIPGYNTGKLKYLFKKIKLGLKLFFKYRELKYLKF